MPNNNATEIVPRLWVGDRLAAKDPGFFYKYDIGAVVNCTTDLPNRFTAHGVAYLRVPVNDSLQDRDIDRMAHALPVAVKFVRDHHADGVLIHCHAGIQRSAAVCAAYLLSAAPRGTTVRQIIHHIVERRPEAFFGGRHINFRRAIDQFARQLRS